MTQTGIRTASNRVFDRWRHDGGCDAPEVSCRNRSGAGVSAKRMLPMLSGNGDQRGHVRSSATAAIVVETDAQNTCSSPDYSCRPLMDAIVQREQMRYRTGIVHPHLSQGGRRSLHRTGESGPVYKMDSAGSPAFLKHGSPFIRGK
jgi:hypothetical protein